jgi:acyl-CoA synthetase (AMP-forming)/AMP-acid ligase II
VRSCSLAEIVATRAERRPDDRAFTFLVSGERDGDALTWAALEGRSRDLAAALVRAAPRRARVLLLFPPGLEFVPAFFASLRAGTIAVPSYPPAGLRTDRLVVRLRGMAADAGVSLVVAPPAVFMRRAVIESIVPDLRGVPWLNTATVAPASKWASARDVSPTDVALLQYTSGSTSDPRGVMVTHANLLHNLESSATLAGHGHDSVAVSWLPVNHDMGLIDGVLQPAYSGFPAWLMAPAAFLQRPERWLQAVSRLRATHSGGPNFAYELCARRIARTERRSLDLSTWRTAYNGSEPVRLCTLEAFHHAFGECGFRWESFRPAYGLAESTLLVASAGPGDEPVSFSADAGALSAGRLAHGGESGHPVPLLSCGRAAPGMQVEIVDPVRRTRSGPGEVGELWVAGPSVAAGYWNRPEDSASTFGARLADTGDGPFLRTGDLGVVSNDQLFITGRLKDVLIVRGLKHYPHDVELTAERAHPALRAGGCAAVAVRRGSSESVTVYAEIESRQSCAAAGAIETHDAEAICVAIARAVNDGHGFLPGEVILVPAGALPRTTSGKLQRFQCLKELGSSRPLHQWNADARLDNAAERVAS